MKMFLSSKTLNLEGNLPPTMPSFLNLSYSAKTWNIFYFNFFMNSYDVIVHFVQLSFFKKKFENILYFFSSKNLTFF